MPKSCKSPACVVCRAPAERGMHNLVQCGRNQYMCKTCAETVLLCFGAKASELPSEHAQVTAPAACPTPQEIVATLDKTVIGQDAAKHALAVAAWKHMQRQRGNIAVPPAHVLLYGPTGCGKTYLAKSIAKIMGVPFVSVDATTFSEAGYRGRDVHDIIWDVLDVAETRSQARNAVVFVDEFDKLSARGGGERQAYQRGTQHGFLTLLEGGEVTAERRYETATLDVSGLLFVFAGAFSGLSDTIAGRTQGATKSGIGFGNALKSTSKPDVSTLLAQAIPEDFVQFGLETELIGRIPVFAPVMPLTISDLVRILTEVDGSVAAQYTDFFKRLNKQFILDSTAAVELASIAHKSGTGARGLRGQLERIITYLLFNLPAEDNITITRDMIAEGVRTP